MAFTSLKSCFLSSISCILSILEHFCVQKLHFMNFLHTFYVLIWPERKMHFCGQNCNCVQVREGSVPTSVAILSMSIIEDFNLYAYYYAMDVCVITGFSKQYQASFGVIKNKQ